MLVLLRARKVARSGYKRGNESRNATLPLGDTLEYLGFDVSRIVKLDIVSACDYELPISPGRGRYVGSDRWCEVCVIWLRRDRIRGSGGSESGSGESRGGESGGGKSGRQRGWRMLNDREDGQPNSRRHSY